MRKKRKGKWNYRESVCMGLKGINAGETPALH